jgi:hypothetical protein
MMNEVQKVIGEEKGGSPSHGYLMKTLMLLPGKRFSENICPTVIRIYFDHM